MKIIMKIDKADVKGGAKMPEVKERYQKRVEEAARILDEQIGCPTQ